MFKYQPIKGTISRRNFLAALGSGTVAARALRATPVPQELYVLKKGDVQRLRLDFNSYRDKVRLLAILSPT
jgi:hypothetical protein